MYAKYLQGVLMPDV